MTTDRRLTASAIRTELRAECSREFRGALHDCDVDQGDISAATGAGEAIVQRWGDVARPETISLVDVIGTARHDRRVALRLLSWAAEKIGARVVEAVAVASGDLLSAVTASVRESGEAHADALSALADGHYTDEELRTIARSSREASCAHAAIEAAALLELERRSVPRARA